MNLIKHLLTLHGMLNRKEKTESAFVRFFKTYIETYDKKDKRVIKQALDRYLSFIESLPEASRKSTPDHETIRKFADYLVASSKGCGAYSTFARFKKVVGHAVKAGVLNENPCTDIRIFGSGNGLVKHILSEEEIIRLLQAHPIGENETIRNAFIFSLYTGLRFCDIINLKNSDIDHSNRMLIIEQSKTKGKSPHSRVHIPLRDDLLELIRHNPDTCDPNARIFILPSHPTCLKALKQWTKEARIHKHITWHCARHTFATNILKNGADIRVVADLLGHSSLKYVETYTRAIDSRKLMAINSLPPLQ